MFSSVSRSSFPKPRSAWGSRSERAPTEAPAGNLRFLRDSWLISNDKLKTGWEPTKTTRETFEETMALRGLLESPAAEFAPTPAEAT